jgi:protein TonB
MLSEFIAPRTIPARINTGRDTSPPPSTGSNMQDMGPSTSSMPGGLFDSTSDGGRPVVQAPLPQKVRVSQGVMAGNILYRPEPAYPAIAKQARIQGAVILSATISKTGAIENLTVVSGPALLAPAAIEAVRQWRYRPYLLNGVPVEVQTLVNVTFTLDG